MLAHIGWQNKFKNQQKFVRPSTNTFYLLGSNPYAASYMQAAAGGYGKRFYEMILFRSIVTMCRFCKYENFEKKK